MPEDPSAAFTDRMRAAGMGETAVRAFHAQLGTLLGEPRADGGLVPESAIEPVEDLPSLDALGSPGDPGSDAALVGQTVFIKLNGGLGTGMGLEKAKSLLEVKDGLTFLDLIARQILRLRESGAAPAVLLMNSFSTTGDTRVALGRYPELGDPADLEFLQNRVPKIDAETGAPVEHPGEPDLEWCPPGHGDLYVALAESGRLDHLLASGIRFAFVSNSDNLGATLDPRLLRHFAESGSPFMMEVTRRTPSDRKGGHLCRDRKTGRLALRESAQCPEADADAFQDIARHRFFNTNNLWIHLPSLRAALAAHEGVLPLPVIRNRKTVDPRDPSSRPVVQLETAMGAAIGCFEGAGAVVVPRSRFAPVKTTADLLALRSDAYRLSEAFTVELDPSREGRPPTVDLDPAHYKLVDGLEALVASAVPSLVRCESLAIRGPARFTGPTTIVGSVEITNPGDEPADIPAGTLENRSVEIG